MFKYSHTPPRVGVHYGNPTPPDRKNGDVHPDDQHDSPPPASPHQTPAGSPFKPSGKTGWGSSS